MATFPPGRRTRWNSAEDPVTVRVVVVAERVQPAHHRVEGPVDGQVAHVSHQVVGRTARRLGVGTGLLDVGRRDVDARHQHPGRGEAAGDPTVATRRVEDPGPGREVEESEDLGGVGVRVLVVDRVLVEVEVVVTERALHVERHASSSPPVGSGCMPDPEDLSFDGATAVRPTADPGLFEADVHEHWTVGDKPNGGYLLALLGRAARVTGRGGGGPDWEVVSSAITYLRPPDLGPATVRTTLLRQGRSASHVRAVLAQDGRDLVDAVFVLGDAAGRADGPLRRHRAAARHRRRRSACACPPDPRRRLRGDHGRPRPPARSGHAPLHRFTPADDARAELRGWTRFADGREPDPLSLLFSVDAIPPATLMIGSTRLGAHAADVGLRAGPPGAGLARHPHDGQPGDRRHGRRDLRPVGQPGPGGGAVHPAGAAPLPRRAPAERGRHPALACRRAPDRGRAAARPIARDASWRRLGPSEPERIAQLCRPIDGRPAVARRARRLPVRAATSPPSSSATRRPGSWPPSRATTAPTSGSWRSTRRTAGGDSGTRSCRRPRTGPSAAGHRSLTTGADPPYFLWPGVPSTETALVCLFERRHYGRIETNFNMDVDLLAHPGRPGGHTSAGPEDAAELDEWSWRRIGPTGGSRSCAPSHKGNLVIAREDGGAGPVTAFCAFEVNRRGLLGPVAVRPDLMGQGAGKGVLLGALHELRRRGAEPGVGRVGRTGRAVRRGRRSGERRLLRLPQGAHVNLLPVPRTLELTGNWCRTGHRAAASTDRCRPQGYELHIGASGVELVGADDAGLFYGEATLTQLARLHDGALPTGARCATTPTSRCAASCSTSPATRCRRWPRWRHSSTAWPR